MRRVLLQRLSCASAATVAQPLATTPLLQCQRFHATAATATAKHSKRTATAPLQPNRHASPPRPRARRSPQQPLHSPSGERSVRPKMRVANVRMSALLASHTSSQDFRELCAQLHEESQVELLAGTDPVVWNVALQRRLQQGDVDGAHALLQLLLGFDAENASEQLWNNVLFTLLVRGSSLSSEHNLPKLLHALQRKCGDDFVANVIVSLVNGCAKVGKFPEARLLTLHHLLSKPLPSSVVGNLVSKMEADGRYQLVVSFTEELLASGAFPLQDVQPQVWIALFSSCAQTKSKSVSRFVDHVIQWFELLKDRVMADTGRTPAMRHGQRHHRHRRQPTRTKRPHSPEFERVLGAVMQRCIEIGHERAALRVFHAMTIVEDDAPDEPTDDADDEDLSAQFTLLGVRPPTPREPPRRLVCPDENIYVNALKACRTLQDKAQYYDVYRLMVTDGVARSAGFGSAIRFAHVFKDAAFLDQVLEDAFAVESSSSRGTWFLPLQQYNDALGCFADTKDLESAKYLFARLLEHPRLRPDHFTMLAMVENYREAPFSDMFELLDVFVELNVTPNKHVFTSLLATCGRHRLINDAMALLDAMRDQGIEPDVKTFTTLGFLYGAHGHLAAIVAMLQEMKTLGVATDAKFFHTILDGLYGAHGIDLCFSLFRDMLAVGLPIPQGMYSSLLRIGTSVGLVERTLHVAYNMECDGVLLSSAQLLALMRRCEAHAEVAELVRTFLLLHQGRQTPSQYQDKAGAEAEDAEEEEEENESRFSREVYEEMVSLLTAFSQRDAIAKVKQLAAAEGYDLLV